MVGLPLAGRAANACCDAADPRTACVRHTGPTECGSQTGPGPPSAPAPDKNFITYITLAEDAESVELYDAVLEIDADGAWNWRRTACSTSVEAR